jgi:hypothetical protein
MDYLSRIMKALDEAQDSVPGVQGVKGAC